MRGYTCHIYADVDFGRGPVEVRCTRTGPHSTHRVDIDLISVEPESTPPDEGVARHNVFEQ